MNTVLITGCASRYGLETARHFHAQGWNVIATMRAPREDLLPRSDRLRVLALDVTKPESIAAALEASGPIDVLVDNAGIGILGAFEATPLATAREVFETNTFGVMAMTQAVLPQLRARRSGVVVNVTSSVTLARMPLVAVYTASKTAIEGFTASLALELEPFDVRVKLVEPGYGPTTRFTTKGASRMEGSIPEAYSPYARRIFAEFANQSVVTTEADVAEAVFLAATDESGQLHFPAGPDAVALASSTCSITGAPSRTAPRSELRTPARVVGSWPSNVGAAVLLRLPRVAEDSPPRHGCHGSRRADDHPVDRASFCVSTLAASSRVDTRTRVASMTLTAQELKKLIESELGANRTKKSWMGVGVGISRNQFSLTTELRERVQGIGTASGCHTCGTRLEVDRDQPWVGDHIPPTELPDAVCKAVMPKDWSGDRYLFPQCHQCSAEQSAVVRKMRQKLDRPTYASLPYKEKRLIGAGHRFIIGTNCIDSSGPRVTATEGEQVQAIGKHRGCHSCSQKYPSRVYHADHTFPQEFCTSYMEQVFAHLGLKYPTNWWLKPQCPRCSGHQGGKMRVIADQASDYATKTLGIPVYKF